jgi:hypothetical protein
VTADEIKIAKAFRAVRISQKQPKTLKLTSDLCSMAENRPTNNLTNNQHAALLNLAIKFRRQIAPEIVELARSLKAQLGPSA